MASDACLPRWLTQAILLTLLALPAAVAHRLNEEFGASFGGREAPDLDFVVPVDRRRQLDAVRAHPSQAVPGSVLWRRLELLGASEFLRWLVRPSGRRADTTD